MIEYVILWVSSSLKRCRLGRSGYSLWYSLGQRSRGTASPAFGFSCRRDSASSIRWSSSRSLLRLELLSCSRYAANLGCPRISKRGFLLGGEGASGCP